jgi:acid phosphatase (class A)
VNQTFSLPSFRFAEVVCSVLLILGGGFAAASAQTISPESAGIPAAAQVGSQSPKRAAGYMHGSEPNFLLLHAPYPALDTEQDKIDVATFRHMQVSDQSARWKLAQADDQMTYARFSEVLGVDLDAARLPIVMHVLKRMERDVLDTTFDAKPYFDRPRPYQRFAVAHVCGADTPPKPEPHPNGGFSASSYPSGHAAFGWGLALTLAEVAPDHAQAILSRGREYGENRVVCAVHYPSDVAAGEIVATTVVERLHVVPEFARDLACAQQEYRAAIQPSVQLNPECGAMEKSLSSVQHAE